MQSWTIYDHPLDFPDCFVARCFIWDKPTAEIITAPELEPLRAHFASLGFTCLERNAADDPKIVEVWL